jgi:uncharacterized BrkB/YihY/UPF0761 family membrane protein
MKLPDPAAAAAGGGMLAEQQQQAAGVLLQQQPPHSTITRILDTLVTSYSRMQASLAVSSSAQSSLSSSLEVLRGQLDSQAAAHKEQERELYLKVSDLAFFLVFLMFAALLLSLSVAVRSCSSTAQPTSIFEVIRKNKGTATLRGNHVHHPHSKLPTLHPLSQPYVK